MEFHAYASSSAGNLYAATAEGKTLLLDCGLRMADIRKALGFSVARRVVGCLLSHSHMDHSKAAGELMRAGVDVYCSAGCWGSLGAIRIEWGHRCFDLAPRREERIGPFRVLPFDTRHDAEGALGFLVGAVDGDRLLFAVDTAYIPYRFSGLTHIAVECNYSGEMLSASDAHPARKLRTMKAHMGLERFIEMLQANELSRVREIHLLHMSSEHGDGRAFVEAVERATGKPAFVAPRWFE